MKTLSISTFNTQGILAFSPEYFKKCKATVEYFNSHQLDIINLQEVFFYHHFSYLRHILTAYPYCIYTPSYAGPRAGLVTFSRFPLERLLYKEFSKLGSYWDSSIKSILGRKGQLVSRVVNTDICVINTHFSANYSNDWDGDNEDTRILQLQIDEFHKCLSPYKRKAITTGDFNIKKESPLYHELIKNSLQDAFKDTYKATQRRGMRSLPNNHQIDYILFSGKDISVTNKNYLFEKQLKIAANKTTYASDHVALQATFNIVPT